MEVAGLALGAIPIALYAVDNYRRCLSAVRDVVRYQATLETFRLNIFIQKKQLEVTLSNAGLGMADGSPTPKSELKARLQRIHPTSHDEFMSILEHIEALLDKLLDKLDVDRQGKPLWTDDPPERAIWNWRRIKRGLGSRERNEIVQELQYWNTALSKILEKPEIPLDEDGPAVQSLQARFDTRACSSIRRNASRIYDAFSRIWQCECPEHRAHLLADWHLGVDKTSDPESDRLILAISTPEGKWKSLSVEPEQHEPCFAQPVPQQDDSTSPAPTLASRRSKRRVKFWFDTTEHPLQTIALPSVTPTIPRIPVTCLCAFIRGYDPLPQGLIHCGEPNSSVEAKKLILRLIDAPGTSQNGFIPLASALSDPSTETTILSRRDRFAIAAAATWAVLYLCGTPWLRENSSFTEASTAIQLGLGRQTPPSSTPTNPRKHPPLASPNTSASQGNTPAPLHQTQPQTPTLIRNNILFALGVLLMELCLNTTLESIWQREQTQQRTRTQEQQQQTPPILDELTLYGLADRESNRVYLDAGHAYGYAVQRCLRCEFPGRDVTKSFEFEPFWKRFFDGVVAPVHAVWSSQVV
ncbi:hypothetical protein B0I37DRAFT_381721 [Chaetomium sp. MPI-CAGE-AT-0009]|nr:hypothetical protein B0I37DRAFT_381721 [Chaetomium sp. MPI-CAGE-AT-0009]